MVGQVKTVSILVIVNGILSALMGLFFVGMGVFFHFMRANLPNNAPNPGDDIAFSIMTFVYPAMGVMALLSAGFSIPAGIRMMQFRSRTFVLFGLFTDTLAVFTFYCAPFSLGIMVYGLVVMFNSDVTKAFELVAKGVSVEEVVERFRPRRRYRDWDEDEDDDRPQRSSRSDPEDDRDDDRYYTPDRRPS